MSEDLKDFFSLIGKAKKEKEDEFRSLVGDINIESIFSSVKLSLEEEKKKKAKQLKEEKEKKEKEARQVKALEAWLYAEPKEEKKSKSDKITTDNLNEKSNFEVIDVIKPQPIGSSIIKEEFIQEVIGNKTETEQEIEIEHDAIDHALKILETITTKEEVRENTTDPEIIKIRRELEYLKNLVNTQGGGGEVRLEFLDDVDRNTAKVNGKFLQYDSSSGKWIGASAGGAGSQNLDQTLGLGNTSSLGMSVGVITATYFVGDGSLLTNLPGGGGNSGYANTAGIATYASSAGIATYATTAGIATYANIAGVSTYATTSGIATYSVNAGVSTYASVSGVATYASIAGISTVSQGLTGNPNIGVNDIIATSATFSGNVSIAGTLTYEDVTNVDSIGLITARNGINIGFPGIAATISSNGSAIFTGIVTATSFAGNLTGNVTGNSDTATYSSSSGIATYATSSGISTYSTTAGVATHATSANYAGISGISTTSQGLTGSPNVQLGFTTITGVGNTALFVDGDVRITGILTIGTNTLTLNGSTNTVQIGSGVTITEEGNANYSGIITATTFDAESVTLNSLTLPDGLISTLTSTLTTVSETSIDTFSASLYRSVKYQIQITRGSEYQITEVFIVHDGTSSYGTEYATVKTGSTLSSFSTDIDSGNVRLLVTPTNTASTTFKLIKTLVEV